MSDMWTYRSEPALNQRQLMTAIVAAGLATRNDYRTDFPHALLIDARRIVRAIVECPEGEEREWSEMGDEESP